MERPTVDVIVPFKGGTEELEHVRRRLAAISLRPGDSVLVVDNTPGHRDLDGQVPVLHAAGLPTPAFARNRGAERGSADWLVFCDADTEPQPELLDRYFDPPPKERTALVAGGVEEEDVPPDAPALARYAYLRRSMTQEDTFSFGEWGYPKSANIACRRAAFEEVHGFREEIRAAEDADLTYRLREAGWEVERREQASVVHASRKTVRGFFSQQLIWGSGGAWIHRHYPGAVPIVARPGLFLWAVRTGVGFLVRLVRKRDRDSAIVAGFRLLEALAWELGRLLPNERPLPESSMYRRLGL